MYRDLTIRIYDVLHKCTSPYLYSPLFYTPDTGSVPSTVTNPSGSPLIYVHRDLLLGVGGG
jgi:hypothetical protein